MQACAIVPPPWRWRWSGWRVGPGCRPDRAGPGRSDVHDLPSRNRRRAGTGQPRALGLQWIITLHRAASATSLSTASSSNTPPTGNQSSSTSKARRLQAGDKDGAEEVAARDLVRPHDGHQRNHAERRDQLEDRSDLGANGRSAEQRLRRLRGARGPARERESRDGASDLRGRERARSRSRSRASPTSRSRRRRASSRRASTSSSCTTPARRSR